MNGYLPSARISMGPHLQTEETGKFTSARTKKRGEKFFEIQILGHRKPDTVMLSKVEHLDI